MADRKGEWIGPRTKVEKLNNEHVMMQIARLLQGQQPMTSDRADGPTWPDGTVRLPEAIESWLDGHFEGGIDDDAGELEQARNVTAVAFWSLIHQKGDPATDRAALRALIVTSLF